MPFDNEIRFRPHRISLENSIAKDISQEATRIKAFKSIKINRKALTVVATDDAQVPEGIMGTIVWLLTALLFFLSKFSKTVRINFPVMVRRKEQEDQRRERNAIFRSRPHSSPGEPASLWIPFLIIIQSPAFTVELGEESQNAGGLKMSKSQNAALFLTLRNVSSRLLPQRNSS